MMYNLLKLTIRTDQTLSSYKWFLFYCALLTGLLSFSQSKISDQKVFLITVDGLRWQELFSGADSILVKNQNYVKHPDKLYDWAWRDKIQDRRSVLMPFIWNEVIEMGQIYGNRSLGNKVNLSNSKWFSYPGYNEILTGKADDQNITSNDKIPNPNETVLEQFARVHDTSKVAAFASWDVFDYIINQERSSVYTNCGFELSTDLPLSSQEILLNKLQNQIPSPWETVRLDGFTHQYAKAYLDKHQPDLIYISYGETDDFAHDGDYESYLNSTKNTDSLIKDLWEYTQRREYYKGKTTFIITTDHGRGTNPIDSWKGHGVDIKGSDQTWIIIFGKGVSPNGEILNVNQLFSNQIAPSIRELLDLPQKKEKGYGIPIRFD